MPLRSRTMFVLFTILAAGIVTGSYATAALRATPKPAVRDPLASVSNPINGKGETLGLDKVTIPVGTVLALHHHPGSDIAYVQQGELTYSVKSGHVTVMSGPASAPRVVRQISAGQTGTLKAGDWIAENPSVIHHAANNGKQPIVIYISWLYPIGAPAAIPNP
jgi:quercetin dioxygenase-like cupin family protein